jgi:hypothetical protein
VAARLNNIIPLREGVDARITHFRRDPSVAQASTETRLRDLIALGFDRIPLLGHVSQSRAMMADPAVMQTAGWPL